MKCLVVQWEVRLHANAGKCTEQNYPLLVRPASTVVLGGSLAHVAATTKSSATFPHGDGSGGGRHGVHITTDSGDQ